MAENATSVLINQLIALRQMSQQYKSDIEKLVVTYPSGVMALQDELETVTGLIFETTQILQEIRDATLKNSRELLKLVPNNPRYLEMDTKLKNLGYGGRKSRKRKSRR